MAGQRGGPYHALPLPTFLPRSLLKLDQLLSASACLHATKCAVVGHAGRMTYGQLEAEVDLRAAGLRSAGARAGDRVAVLLANGTEAAVSIWAVLRAGCVIVPVHAALRGEPLQATLRDAQPRWVITARELAASWPALREALPQLAGLFVWEPPDAAPVAAADGTTMPWRVGAIGSADETVPQASGTDVATQGQGQGHSAASGDAVAALIYTSGSTGEPKGVMLSHANMLAAIKAVNAYLHLHSGDVIYSALPLSSSYGLYQLLMGHALGATVVLDRSFAFPAKSLALLAAERATVLAGVPTMFAWIAGATVLGNHDLSSLRVLTSAAASLPVEHARRVRERLPQARLYVMYGQTECKRITYLPPEDFDTHAGSVGRGMPFQEHAVIDEAGRPVEPGATGELVVRGPHVMLGYFNRPEETARKLRLLADGSGPWLHTDDLFRIDEQGYLHFVGRKDDILKVGGHKVSPREIEEVIVQMPQVREAAVIGIPDDAWGQAAKAYVVLREGATLEAEDVIRYCSARLRGFMVPKQVSFARDLPKTESGKVKKRELR
jgi:amino acid adenylation domain-containing protein